MGATSELIKQAEETGRCKIFYDNFGGTVTPGEAALMADVCIGKVQGVTAALEAQLIGSPSLLIDTEHFYYHPFYSWATQDVLFSDWKSLRLAVEKYRTNPEAYPEFGNWSPQLNTLDPYQDGKASLRMGSYIGWVYNALKQGEPKQAALESANNKFQSQWVWCELGLYKH